MSPRRAGERALTIRVVDVRTSGDRLISHVIGVQVVAAVERRQHLLYDRAGDHDG
jgi:hypothetical protein